MNPVVRYLLRVTVTFLILLAGLGVVAAIVLAEVWIQEHFGLLALPLTGLIVVSLWLGTYCPFWGEKDV